MRRKRTVVADWANGKSEAKRFTRLLDEDEQRQRNTAMKIEFQQHESERVYPIGFEFRLKRGKQDARDCRVTDYRIVHDSKGSIVKFSYVLTYEFAGQLVKYEVPQTTIDIATNNGWKQLAN